MGGYRNTKESVQARVEALEVQRKAAEARDGDFEKNGSWNWNAAPGNVRTHDERVGRMAAQGAFDVEPEVELPPNKTMGVLGTFLGAARFLSMDDED